MSETKHTQGKWKKIVMNDGSVNIVSGVQFVCQVGVLPSDNDQDDLIDADARLIAAAPELLSALLEICDANEFCKDDWGDRRDAWIETARAAIAKATGAAQ